MKQRLGNYLIRTLEARGVRHVFGIPGVHNLELYRGLAASSIRHVTGRHEQGLGFMADGYARVTGQPGVCFTITGPGLTNIITAMGQAYGDSIPLIVISSENRLGEIGTGCGFLHELPDQLGIAAKVSVSAERVTAPDRLADAIARAFAAASGARPRPAYLEIPRDVLAAEASGLPAPLADPARPHPAASSAGVDGGGASARAGARTDHPGGRWRSGGRRGNPRARGAARCRGGHDDQRARPAATGASARGVVERIAGADSSADRSGRHRACRGHRTRAHRL